MARYRCEHCGDQYKMDSKIKSMRSLKGLKDSCTNEACEKISYGAKKRINRVSSKRAKQESKYSKDTSITGDHASL